MLPTPLWGASTVFSLYGLLFFGGPLLVWATTTWCLSRAAGIRPTFLFAAAAVGGVTSLAFAMSVLPTHLSDTYVVLTMQGALWLGGLGGATLWAVLARRASVASEGVVPKQGDLATSADRSAGKEAERPTN